MRRAPSSTLPPICLCFLPFLPFVWQQPKLVSSQHAFTSQALIGVLRYAAWAVNFFELRTAADAFSVRGLVYSGCAFEDVKKRRYFPGVHGCNILLRNGNRTIHQFTEIRHWLE